jgi:hypothetical protein
LKLNITLSAFHEAFNATAERLIAAKSADLRAALPGPSLG